jgi:diguanylate cyclase (GGDEF)-like protein
LAYRYGGEEFTIVFPNHGADEIKSHLQDLIQAVANTPFVVNRRRGQKPQEVQVTISIGVTDSIGKADAASTIKTADQALYTAKKKGRNRLQMKR